MIAIIISIIAATLSFWGLWLSRLKPFKLLVASGEIRLRIYPVKNGKKKWYILTLATPVHIANVGAKAGQVTSFRIVAHFAEISDSAQYEVFDLYGEVDRKLYEENAEHIFKWQNTATIKGDEPFIMLPHSTISKYLIFKTYTNFPIGSKKVTFTLEVSEKRNNEWRNLETWTMPLLPVYWSELTENRTSIGTVPESFPSIKPKIDIDNEAIHKTLKIKRPLPKGGFQAAPTYLDYPAKDDSDHISG